MGNQGTITFIDNHEPPLKAGEYRVTVRHDVSGTGTLGPFDDQFVTVNRFAVQGRRFMLDPAVFYSVFPPASAIGDFSHYVPHVVLTPRTLPWERALFEEETKQTEKPYPWLALMLFSEHDDVVEHDRITVNDLQRGAYKDALGTEHTGTLDPSGLSYGLEELEYGESPTDACSAIDIPVRLFNQVAPSADDLAWLAHARRVDMSDKGADDQNVADGMTAPDRPPNPTPAGDFTVLVGNRLPEAPAAGSPGTEYTVHLVSLDHIGDYLPGTDGSQSFAPASPAGVVYTFVRLVSLKKWTFTSQAVEHSFRGILENLNGGQPARHDETTPRVVPLAALRPSPPASLTNGPALAALRLGYVPLNHHLRYGDPTASWYRGPLVPFELECSKPPLVTSADAALRLDPDLGMFDVSYAAAWQLGRLLALKSQSFADSLYQWKLTIRRGSQAALRPPAFVIPDDLHQEILTILTAAAPEKNGSRDGNGNQPRTLGQLTSFLQDSRSIRSAAAAPPDLSGDAQLWLGKLSLLYPVPFEYLVPDAAMLPPESIRFFYVDPTWVAHLIDGAYSLGSNSPSDFAQDAAFVDALHGAALRASKRLRPNNTGTLDDANEVITGVLLRSDAITYWPGIEVNGYDAHDAELQVLRMSELRPNVLLVLFNGVVTQLNLHQPPEGLHFGVDRTGGECATAGHDVEKDLKPLAAPLKNTSTPSEDGVLVLQDAQRRTVDAGGNFRAGGLRVLQIDALRRNIESSLQAQEVLATTDSLSAATFSLEMIEGVDAVVFSIL